MGSKLYETRPEIFLPRFERLHHNVDAAASDKNALLRPLCSIAPPPWVPVAERGSEAREWTEPGATWNGRCSRCQACVGRYYTEATNGLNPEHYEEGDRVWCNPPFDYSIYSWLKLASECRRRGILWDCLLPSSTGTRWFQDFVWDRRFGRPREGVELDFTPGRITFLLDGKPVLDKNGKEQQARHETIFVTFWPEGMRP